MTSKFIRGGLIGGLIFGLVTVWQGVGAAMLVVLLSLTGAALGCAVWVVWRVVRGDLDPQSLRALLEEVFQDRNRNNGR